MDKRSELRLGEPEKDFLRRILFFALIQDSDLANRQTMSFFYVYILQSELDLNHFYVGLTEDLKARLKKHNAGEVPHTAKFKPWRVKTAIAFTSRERATAFEQYLKSASGRAFAKKRL